MAIVVSFSKDSPPHHAPFADTGRPERVLAMHNLLLLRHTLMGFQTGLTLFCSF